MVHVHGEVSPHLGGVWDEVRMNEGYVDGRRSKIRQLLLMRSTSNMVRGLGGKVFWSRMFIFTIVSRLSLQPSAGVYGGLDIY
jgi:hypothetical protein